MRAFVLLALVACTPPVIVSPGEPAMVARVDRYLAPYVAMHDFAGSVLVVRNDKVILRKTYGDGTTAPTCVGSITKTVTAAAIEVLATRGKLSLSDPIGRYVPGLPYGNNVTIEQLLDHRAGVPDYYTFPEFAERHTEDIALPELVSLIAAKPLEFTPGAKESYSNSGYVLLAAAIEAITSNSYGQFVATEVIAPFHLEHSGDVTNGRPADLAPGRDPGFPPDLVQPAAEIGNGWLVGNGSFYTTAADLMSWARSQRTLVTPYGWGQHDHAGHRVLEQDGRIPGYAAYVGVSDDRIGVVVLSTIQSHAVTKIGIDLLELARGKDVAPPATRPTIAPDAALANFAGTYRVGPGFAMTVAATPQGLTLAAPDGIALPLDRTGPATFFFRPLYIQLEFADDKLVWGTQKFAREY